eukprot:CAMPEP_0172813138 /NCGR_PEP_ID=MMETSP1075-20121228/10473_1 /TAXON_ID=2916 /ORGANISM="Ceratium fusus, Strain PA161109" /LENGTH=62 /DNA_ID=CAMNT_0013652791 /DNA_START=44 /DNA_END=229 /DNA_ORIENTATION=-
MTNTLASSEFATLFCVAFRDASTPKNRLGAAAMVVIYNVGGLGVHADDAICVVHTRSAVRAG